MANSYHQSWQRASIPYNANIPLEPDYTYHGYTTQSKSSNTPNVPLPSDTTYPQSSPPYSNTTNGPYIFDEYPLPAQDEESYDKFSRQSLSDHGFGDSLMNETAQMPNNYLSPQPDLKSPYVYHTADMTQAFQFQPTNGDMGSGYKRPRYTHPDAPDELEADHQENKEGLKPRWVYDLSDTQYH